MNLQKSIDYFKSLIDDQGIIQFTKGYEKDYEYGYAIEDQARGLILARELGDESLVKLFGKVIERSVIENGVVMLWDKTGKYQDKIDINGEAVAEVVWALRETKLMNNILISPYPRAWAYAILGGAVCKDKESVIVLGNKIVEKYNSNASEDWKWLEPVMTYGNALFPWSLLEAYKLTNYGVFLFTARAMMDFLLDNFIKDNKPVVVGFDGWWKKGQEMALFGQQPVDVALMVLSCIEFWKTLGDKKYLEKAKWYFSWFSGNNLLNLSMIREDGACFDGLLKNGVNPNAGAESNICYLLAAVKIQQHL
jgi:hypothetical protein